MDAALGHVPELDQLVVARQPQLQPRRAETETEERLGDYCKTLT
jgi:hypothetical protein